MNQQQHMENDNCLSQTASFAGGVHASLVRFGFKMGEMRTKSLLSSEERLCLCMCLLVWRMGGNWV